jgi:hypothetical protein
MTTEQAEELWRLGELIIASCTDEQVDEAAKDTVRNVIKEWCEEYHDNVECDGKACALGCEWMVERIELEAKLEVLKLVTKRRGCAKCALEVAERERKSIETRMELAGFTSPESRE